MDTLNVVAQLPALSIRMVERLEELALRANMECDYATAHSLLLQVLDFRVSRFGERNPRTIECMHDIGTNALAMGRWQVAYDYLTPAHALAEQLLGPLHPRTQSLCDQLALLRRLRLFPRQWRSQPEAQARMTFAR
jgi:hypothetical protein